jgi:hypothetical protein
MGKGPVTASAATQQLKRFLVYQIKGLLEFAVGVIGEFQMGDNHGRFVVKEDSV